MKTILNVLLATLIPAYLIGAAALAYYGYTAYFDVPSEYITISSVFYSIFALNTISVTLAVLYSVAWWQWGLALLALIVLGVTAKYSKTFSEYTKLMGIAISIALLIKLFFGMVDFGELIAMNQTRFVVPSTECGYFGPEAQYIMPIVKDDVAVVVGLDRDNKLTPGFQIWKTSDIGCRLEYKEVGLVKK